jgi:hypothetical protein
MARIQSLTQDAATHEHKARETLQAASNLGREVPPGQPILVGHRREHAMRRHADKIDAKLRVIADHTGKSTELKQKAAAIQEATDRAIYQDDPDVVARLEKRLDGLLRRRESIRQYNRTCRGGQPQQSYLCDEDQRRLEQFKKSGDWQLGPDRAMPAFVLHNLTRQIAKVRQRLAGLQRKMAVGSRPGVE